MVLKCADIGHLAADLNTHKRWACQLEEEFYRQVHNLSKAMIAYSKPVAKVACQRRAYAPGLSLLPSLRPLSFLHAREADP